MNILRRALFHQNLFSTAEDAYPGSPLSSPVQSQTSHHLSGGLEVENYLAFTAAFNLSGAAPTWSASSAVYTRNTYLEGASLSTAPMTSFNKGQVSTGTGSTDPIQARIDINTVGDPNGFIGSYPRAWGILMHIKTGNKIPMTTMLRQSVSIIRFDGQARFDPVQLASGDAMILKVYLTGNPR